MDEESDVAALMDALEPLAPGFDWPLPDVDVDDVLLDLEQSSPPESTDTLDKDDSKPTQISIAAGKNSTRERLKAELTYLRDKVETLEGELQSLKAKEATSVTEDATAAPMWRRIAIRQVERRRVAEAENTRLKTVLDAQIQVAKSFEQILRKRSNEVVLDLYEGARGSRKRHRSEDDFSVVYQQFLEEIQSAYAIVDQVFDARNLSDEYNESVRNYTTKTRSTGAHEQVYVEYVDVTVLPFPFEKASRAIWEANIREYLDKKRPIQNSRREVDHFGVRVVFQGTHTLTCTIVTRQYVESDRLVLVWRALNRVSSASQFYADETGWTVVKRVPTSNGASEKVAMQTCVQLVPRWLDSDLALPHPGSRQIQAGELTKAIVESIEEGMLGITENVENLLLDEAIGERTALSALSYTNSNGTC
ncbi:hypothetical protein Poli38472_004988 [Pythium oligandrum]|uniref:Uncharacterized protein n=1 Tax=Pythium oligandrum TaxID=41045 RepID=A0A8K1CAT2_PYTOL|nr:hypothetical protein Poli38472_004988 [Pythium oligandrum]|eukprot:TMW59919.1 hypothetical protein Poli38472_004988 [Pythium oligandrum]